MDLSFENYNPKIDYRNLYRKKGLPIHPTEKICVSKLELPDKIKNYEGIGSIYFLNSETKILTYIGFDGLREFDINLILENESFIKYDYKSFDTFIFQTKTREITFNPQTREILIKDLGENEPEKNKNIKMSTFSIGINFKGHKPFTINRIHDHDTADLSDDKMFLFHTRYGSEEEVIIDVYNLDGILFSSTLIESARVDYLGYDTFLARNGKKLYRFDGIGFELIYIVDDAIIQNKYIYNDNLKLIGDTLFIADPKSGEIYVVDIKTSLYKSLGDKLNENSNMYLTPDCRFLLIRDLYKSQATLFYVCQGRGDDFFSVKIN